MQHGIAHPHFAGSSVSLDAFKYVLGVVATTVLAEKIKTPEQRYLLMAAVGFGVGLLETGWRDHINGEREPIRFSPVLEATLKDLIQSVKAQGLEGLVAKRRNSKYDPGLRSGAWLKMRVNQGQELVIGGYTPSPKNFDALDIGYYEGPDLIYAARTRDGFTPASRVELFKRVSRWKSRSARLPICRRRRLAAGRGIDGCQDGRVQVAQTVLVGQFEFVEWTEDSHLRHSRLMAMRDNKEPKDVKRER